ncbi:hypothetical protein [Sporosarcina ureae]|uniref:hypothetical protein n=1 Tax=Sporosarcina ureae TaxID=1571 RepID=UPI0028ABB426|nr:hypothetical protein [Sporosarcina ureae]
MSTKSTKKPLLVAIILLLTLLIMVAGIIIYQLVSKDKQQLQEEETGLFETLEQDTNVIVAEGGKSLSDSLADLQKEVDEGHVSLSMDVNMSVEENSSIGQTYLENPIANRYDMFVTIFLDETQNIIGKTGIIPRGNAIEIIELDAKLEKGSHPATITYNLINEKKQVVEQASVGIEIIVK